jgi:Uma2 family endonuclease
VLPADASYQCFADDPTKVRKPDVSFIQASRLPASERPTGHCQIAPDLAVEVVSPNDLFEDVSRKVEEYLAAGVRLVWVIDPKAERVFIYRQDGSATILTNKDSLDGEDVVPGFLCAIADLFKPPAGVEIEWAALLCTRMSSKSSQNIKLATNGGSLSGRFCGK